MNKTQIIFKIIASFLAISTTNVFELKISFNNVNLSCNSIEYGMCGAAPKLWTKDQWVILHGEPTRWHFDKGNTDQTIVIYFQWLYSGNNILGPAGLLTYSQSRKYWANSNNNTLHINPHLSRASHGVFVPLGLVFVCSYVRANANNTTDLQFVRLARKF